MDERLRNIKLIDELDFTFIDVENQLVKDEIRYGDTWKERGIVNQEQRFIDKIHEYFNDYERNGKPIPWVKIIGEAHIALVREKKLSH